MFWIRVKITPYTQNGFVYCDLPLCDQTTTVNKVSHLPMFHAPTSYSLGMSPGLSTQTKGKSDEIGAQ